MYNYGALCEILNKHIIKHPYWVLVSNIFYFHPENCGRFPFWLIFFNAVGTTNYSSCFKDINQEMHHMVSPELFIRPLCSRSCSMYFFAICTMKTLYNLTFTISNQSFDDTCYLYITRTMSFSTQTWPFFSPSPPYVVRIGRRTLPLKIGKEPQRK